MASLSVAERSQNLLPQDALSMLDLLTNDLNEIRKAMTCGICVKTLYEPYTTSCGHTFCYRCLSEWFGKGNGGLRKKTCPDCRAEIRHPPSPAYLVRGVAHMFTTKLELLGPGESPNEHERGREEEAGHLEVDKNGPGLFPNCFRQHDRFSHVIHDVEDGVDRCPRCTWELQRGSCSNANCTWQDPFMVESSDEDSSGEEYDDSNPYDVHLDERAAYHGLEDQYADFDSDEGEDDTDPGSLDDFVVDEDDGDAPIDLRSDSDASASHLPSLPSTMDHSDSDSVDFDDRRLGHPRTFRFHPSHRSTGDSPVRQTRSRRIIGNQDNRENSDRRDIVGQADASEAGDSTAGSDQAHPHEYRHRTQASPVQQFANQSDVSTGSFSDSVDSGSPNPSTRRSSMQPQRPTNNVPQTGISRGRLGREPQQIQHRRTSGLNVNAAHSRPTPVPIHEISSDSDEPIPSTRMRRRRIPQPRLPSDERQAAANTDASSSTLLNERHGLGHMSSGPRPRVTYRPSTSSHGGISQRSSRIVEAGITNGDRSLSPSQRDDPNIPGAFPPSFNQSDSRDLQYDDLPTPENVMPRDSILGQLLPHRVSTDRALHRSPGMVRNGGSGPPHDRHGRHARKAARRIERERIKAEQEARRG